jgi:hypothetical protein
VASKFKIKMKLTGFELEIEGNREDVPLMAQAVGKQMSSFLAPASSVIEGEIIEVDSPSRTQGTAPFKEAALIEGKTQKKRSSPSKNRSAQTSNTTQATSDYNWSHSVESWGYPRQEWSTFDKSVWLLYVVSQELSVTEMSTKEIETTFNKHFRQAKAILSSNVRRDFGRKKTSKPFLLGENTSGNPQKWYLTMEGVKYAKELVNSTLA